MKKIAISQIRYLPAINYFQRIHIADIFVILDNVQHQRRSFEHRNRIKLLSGKESWLSVPIDRTDGSRMNINEMRFANLNWVKTHKAVIRHNYSKARFFDRGLLNEIYDGINGLDFVNNIQKMNEKFCGYFHIDYNFVKASSLGIESCKDKQLYDIVKKLNGDAYISGPNGRDYISKDLFSDKSLLFHDFEFPRYEEFSGQFLPWMCIWDQLFNIGIKETERLIKSNILLNKK